MLKSLLLTHNLTHIQAAMYGMFAYMLFSVSDGLGKYLMSEGFDRSFVLTMTSTPSFIILTCLMIYRKGLRHAYHTPNKLLHTGRAISIIGVSFIGFMALQKLPLSDFYGIVFTGPLLLTLGAFVFFKEKIKLTEAIIILIGFSGALIIASPSGEGGFNIGYFYAALAVICMASAGLFVRKIGHGDDPYLYVIFANLGVILANMMPAILSDLPTIELIHILSFGIYCLTIPTAILTLSAVFARAPSVASIAPFQYTQIIWGSIFGYIVFGDIPQMNTIIGSGIIISCGLYILLYHKRKKARELN
jgi:drug/metabolite transporter (DMT)-like permease